MLLSIAAPVLIAQEKTTGHIGATIRLGSDKQYIEITSVRPGWPAEIYGLRPGYYIYVIDDKPVKEITDIAGQLGGVPGTYTKLSGKRIGADSLFNIKVPRISISSQDSIYLSEGEMAVALYHKDMSENNLISISVMHDEESNMLQYKSFDFDYTDAADPLLEKEIFKLLEPRLLQKGLVRDKKNPDILILMKTFAGQKEQYIQPEQIISTRVQTVYNWRWGLVPMPITQSQTRQGYTEITYLYSISLKFLDAHRIDSSKIPPVIWSASFSETAKKKTALPDKAAHYFDWLLWQYPVSWYHNADGNYSIKYEYTGIIYNRNDVRTIADVIPGSPAAIAGIKKGDKIITIMNEGIMPRLNEDIHIYRYGSVILKGGENKGFRYLILSELPKYEKVLPEMRKFLKNGIPDELEFRIEQNGKKSDFKIKPERKEYYNYFTIK